MPVTSRASAIDQGSRFATKGGNPILILGPSRSHVEALLDGRTVHITATELLDMGLPPSMEMMLMAFDTEGSVGMPIDEPQPGPRIRMEPRREEQDSGLRSLCVHRLVEEPKAIFRVALRTGRFSVHCKPCSQFNVDVPLEEWQCDRCGRV